MQPSTMSRLLAPFSEMLAQSSQVTPLYNWGRHRLPEAPSLRCASTQVDAALSIFVASSQKSRGTFASGRAANPDDGTRIVE